MNQILMSLGAILFIMLLGGSWLPYTIYSFVVGLF